VVKVAGGGQASQAEAIRHGSARAIVAEDATTRSGIKRKGYLTRDPRAKERRKFGLKKARKAGQWSKR
jgi:small subunit ribosomal protein S9